MSGFPFVPTPDTLDAWPQAFEQSQIDYVPDPMVLRVGDLFIGGPQRSDSIPRRPGERLRRTSTDLVPSSECTSTFITLWTKDLHYNPPEV